MTDSRDVRTEVQVLERLRSETRAWNLSATVILAILLAICIGTLNHGLSGLTHDGPQRDQFVAALSGRLQQSAIPTLEGIGVQALHSVDYAGEIKKLNQRTPQLAAASMTQLQTLGQDLPTRGQAALNTDFDALLQSRQAKIRAMYPNATDQQVNTMMAALTQEVNSQTGTISAALFAPHVQAMNAIVADLDTIRRTEPGSQGQTPTWDMAVLLAGIAGKDFQGIVPAHEANQLTLAAGQMTDAATRLTSAAAPLTGTAGQVSQALSQPTAPGGKP